MTAFVGCIYATRSGKLTRKHAMGKTRHGPQYSLLALDWIHQGLAHWCLPPRAPRPLALVCAGPKRSAGGAPIPADCTKPLFPRPSSRQPRATPQCALPQPGGNQPRPGPRAAAVAAPRGLSVSQVPWHRPQSPYLLQPPTPWFGRRQRGLSLWLSKSAVCQTVSARRRCLRRPLGYDKAAASHPGGSYRPLRPSLAGSAPVQLQGAACTCCLGRGDSQHAPVGGGPVLGRPACHACACFPPRSWDKPTQLALLIFPFCTARPVTVGSQRFARARARQLAAVSEPPSSHGSGTGRAQVH